MDKDHVHFLIQSVPTYSVTGLVKMIKSLTAREIFKRCPHVKKQLWGGEFWSDDYFASTVGKHGDENMISKYVKEQGGEYVKLHQSQQLSPPAAHGWSERCWIHAPTRPIDSYG